MPSRLSVVVPVSRTRWSWTLLASRVIARLADRIQTPASTAMHSTCVSAASAQLARHSFRCASPFHDVAADLAT
eukprot:239856-Prorocentrum_lima.AAC.1